MGGCGAISSGFASAISGSSRAPKPADKVRSFPARGHRTDPRRDFDGDSRMRNQGGRVGRRRRRVEKGGGCCCFCSAGSGFISSPSCFLCRVSGPLLNSPVGSSMTGMPIACRSRQTSDSEEVVALCAASAAIYSSLSPSSSKFSHKKLEEIDALRARWAKTKKSACSWII